MLVKLETHICANATLSGDSSMAHSSMIRLSLGITPAVVSIRLASM
jgi:hypothetical protein